MLLVDRPLHRTALVEHFPADPCKTAGEAGDFGKEVAAGQRDEIGFLVESFNQMTQALKKASAEAEVSCPARKKIAI